MQTAKILIFNWIIYNKNTSIVFLIYKQGSIWILNVIWL